MTPRKAAAPKPPRAPRAEAFHEERRTCPHCRASFQARTDDARSCGKGMCWALDHWDQDAWDGMRRMVEALQVAGTELVRQRDDEGDLILVRQPVELTAWDREALTRGRATA